MTKLILNVLGFLMLASATLSAQAISKSSLLQLTILGVPPTEAQRLNGNYQIDKGGTIRLPLLDQPIRAAGLEPAELSKRIEQAYKAAEIYTQPRISVVPTRDAGDLIERFFTVMGDVKSPGLKPHQRDLTLQQAVAIAGDRTEFASSIVRLYRNGTMYEYDLANPRHKTLKIYPDDTIDVTRQTTLGGLKNLFKGNR